MEVACFISMLSSYQPFGLKKLFLYNSENISSERWCVFVQCIHMYLFLCKYINRHSSVYVIRVNSTKHSVVVGFLFCFFYSKKGQILERLCFCGGVCSVFVILMICP